MSDSEDSASSVATEYGKDMAKCPGCKHVGYDGGFRSCQGCWRDYCEFCADEKQKKGQSMYCERCECMSGVMPDNPDGKCLCCKKNDKLQVETDWLECEDCHWKRPGPGPRPKSPKLVLATECSRDRIIAEITEDAWAEAEKKAIDKLNAQKQSAYDIVVAEYPKQLAEWEKKQSSGSCEHVQAEEQPATRKRARSPSPSPSSNSGASSSAESDSDELDKPEEPVFKEATTCSDILVRDHIPMDIWVVALQKALDGINAMGRKLYEMQMTEYKSKLAAWEAQQEARAKKKQRK